MARQKREVVGTTAVHALLRKRYAAPAWALLQEVRNETGYARTVRTADALAMSLWPSRGLEVHGFEVKCSRGDLRKELDDPDKAREIMQYCDRWWLVLGHKDLIQPGELPPTWGLMAAQKNRLVAITEAPKLDSKPLGVGFVASILRNVTETYVPRGELTNLVNEKYKEWQARDRDTDETKILRTEIKALEESIRLFEEASGVNIRVRWQIVQIGEAVRYVMHRNFGMAKKQLEHLRAQAERIVESAAQEIETLAKLEEMDVDCID